MRKIHLKRFIAALFTICFFLTSCSRNNQKSILNEEQQSLADVVINNIDKWEIYNDSFCASIELRKVDGKIKILCQYSNEKREHTNEAVSSMSISETIEYIVDKGGLSDGKEGQKIGPWTPNHQALLSSLGITILGSITYYPDDDYDTKKTAIENLFLELQ